MPPRSSMAGFTLLPVILAMSLIAAIAFLLNRDNGMNAGIVAGQSDADRARYTAEAGIQVVNALSQAKNCTGYTNLNTTAFGAGSFTATVTPASGTPVTLTATGTAGGTAATLTRSNITVYQTTPSTLTLQPNAAGGIDAWLNSASAKVNINNGVNPSLYLSVSGSVYRPLLKFDLSALPAGSVITAATLSLYQDRTGSVSGANPVYNLHRVTRAWVEGTQYGTGTADGATWNSFDGIAAWTAPGGDFDPAVAASTPAAATIGWKTWDVSGLVRDWVSGAFPNNGMLLNGVGTISALSFASSDNGTAANNPKLVVTYLAPCGAPPPPPPPPSPGTTVTLTAIHDTWINETSGKTNTNYGGDPSFTVTTATKKSGHGLVQFDLSSIPAGTKFTSATLRLWAGGFSATTPPTSSNLTVYPVTNYVPWTENGATWNTANGSSNSWGCGNGGGGCFGAAAASATLSSSFTPGGWVEWDVTALAQEWFDGVSPNYGVGVLIDTASSVAFNSKEATFAPQYMPQLMITY